MDVSVNFVTPVGRLVQGSLYDKVTKDAMGNPLTYKTGKNIGQPRVTYYFGLAIAKGKEQHWKDTEWGAVVWNAASQAYSNKIPANFAWKITDGDSNQIPVGSKSEVSPCQKEGYPGHWVLNLSSDFPPSIHTADGQMEITEPGKVKLGDYIQVAASVNVEQRQLNPGIFLNHHAVAFSAQGKRIATATRVDAKTVGFGGALPANAEIDDTPNPFKQPASVAPVAPAPVAKVSPYPEVLTPPPAPPARRMTAAATASYESYIASGWTDALLIQHGFMQA